MSTWLRPHLYHNTPNRQDADPQYGVNSYELSFKAPLFIIYICIG